MLEKFRRFRRKGVIELLSACHDFFRCSCRTRISGTEFDCGIRIAQRIVLAQTLCLSLEDFFRKRHHISLYGFPKFLHIRSVIAASLHTIVSEFHEILIAEFLPHAVAKVNQFIIETVEFRLIVLIPLSFRFPGGKSPTVVRIILKRRHLRKRINLPLKRNLGRGK